MNPGAETIQIFLSRTDGGQPWGFRLQGGADFTTPLSIQSVNAGGVGERGGLLAGDAVLSINGQDTGPLDHEDAKRLILMSTTSCQMVIERGAVSVWRPKVTPMSELKSGTPQSIPDVAGGALPYTQKTSLAANQNWEPCRIGSAHNRTAKPFPGFGGGAAPAQPAVVNAQFNTPINMYSANNQQQAYDNKAQQISSGMAGLQVQDSEKDSSAPSGPHLSVQGKTSPPRSKSPTFVANVNGSGPKLLAANDTAPVRSYSPTAQLIAKDGAPIRSYSPTAQLLAEEESVKRSRSPTATVLQTEEAQRRMKSKESSIYRDVPEGEERQYSDYVDPNKQSFSFKMLEKDLAGGGDGSGVTKPSGMRSVQAPTTLPPEQRQQPTQSATCNACGRLIVGVFVKVRGQPMHAECYKCCRCGTSLKQKGFIVIEDRLHCEPCARQVAQPPEPGLEIDEVVYS